MSSLFKRLRVHQVFGANTDVGKTIITTALARSSAASQKSVFYLKPVSTGPMSDADDEHIKRHSGPDTKNIQTSCLYRFNDPVSPHLAVKMGKGEENVPSDHTFSSAIRDYIHRCASKAKAHSHMYIETAGGVHSPTLTGTTQLEAYRPLFLPTILVGDSKLGGISSTISAYESILLRGYIIDAILLFKDAYYRNWEYLDPYFAEKGVSLFSVEAPPPLVADPAENFTTTEKYYDTSLEEFNTIQTHLDGKHTSRLTELSSMSQRTLDTIWYPFVQHCLIRGPEEVTIIDSAHTDFFSVYKDTADSQLQPYFDGSASWWTQAFGHAPVALTLAAARASGRYGHVMFPKASHLPALQLAERLVKDGPGKGWASRAYFSDDGSTGMEIALKMALRAYAVRHGLAKDEGKKLGILGLKGSYHGDTIGAMDACEEGVYTCEWHEAKGYWFDFPTISVVRGKVVVSLPPAISSQAEMMPGIVMGKTLQEGMSLVYNVSKRLDSPLASAYRRFIQTALANLKAAGHPNFGALVMEPLVMGAGGMLFVDPLFQRVLVDVIRGTSTSTDPWSGLPVIFDEVFVGLHRLGMETTSTLLGVNPDISVNAKILTGGLIPLAVTLTSNSIFEAFFSEKKVDALLHGHSYTAHAIGCEVANETLRIIDNVVAGDSWNDARTDWSVDPTVTGPTCSLWSPSFISVISQLPIVSESMTLGTVLAIKIKDDGSGYASHVAEQAFKSLSDMAGSNYGVHYRTLGDVAYFMTSLNTPPDTIRSLEDKIYQCIAQ